MAYNKLQVKDLAYGTLIEDTSSSIKIAGDLFYSLPTDTTTNGNFYLTVDDEILLVTDVATDVSGHYDFDVVRAQEGTSYVSHISGNKAYLNVIAKNINNIQDYISLIDTSSNVDLNSMEAAIALNTAKVTNANHTGDVTGADVLGIVPTAISGRSEVTPATGDYVLLWDATDSTLKKSLVDTFISGGGGDVTGPASATLNSIAIFDSTTGKHITGASNVIVDGTNMNVVGTLYVDNQLRNNNQHTLDSSGAVSWNFNDNPCAKLIPTSNVTLTITNTMINSNASLYLIQDSTSAKTITWDGNIIWSGGYEPDISTLGSKHFFNFFSYDGTGIWGSHISNENQVSGLINVQDSTGNIYYIGEDATGKKSSWISGAATTAIQVGENLGIYTSANLSEILNGAYVDSTGSYRYSSSNSTDKAIRLSFNETSNDWEWYFSTDTTSTVDGYVDFKKGYQVGLHNFSMRDSTGGLRINLDSTAGNITTMGTVNGRNMTTDGSKLDGIESGAQVNTVTASSTTTFTNKRNTPRVTSLTSASTVTWNSDTADIYRLNLAHNAVIANDASGTPSDGEIKEFSIYHTGTYTFNFDTTSATKPFKFGTDMTGITSDSSGKTSLVLTQYDSTSGKWNILSQIRGY